MATIAERLEALQYLRELMTPDHPVIQSLIRQACLENPWFTEDDYWYAVNHIATTYLDNDALFEFAASYQLFDRTESSRRVGIVMAGNIPLVGFHDFLCVFLTGHPAKVKWSEKDEVVFPGLIQLWLDRYPWVSDYLQSVSKLRDFDAVIATGSNQTARYFQEYFGKYPHIIRKNRNAIAILNGSETRDDLGGISDDILRYFGKGCRNVSLLWVPANYDFSRLLEALDAEEERIVHHKYKHNYDYNLAIYIINQVPYLASKPLLLVENDSINSRIGTLHFRYYQDLQEVADWIMHHQDEIQCMVGEVQLPGNELLSFGQAQKPGLATFPDGIDVMDFLLTLR